MTSQTAIGTFHTSKLFFLTGLPEMRQVPEELRRGQDPAPNGGSLSIVHMVRSSIPAGNSNKARIYNHLRRVKPKEFTAADLAKVLDLTTRSVAAFLKDIPGVRIKCRRKYAHTESGNRYTFYEVKGGRS